MNPSTLPAIQETFAASNAGTSHFAQVIGRLMGAAVESYHVDYRAHGATYYLRSGKPMRLRWAARTVMSQRLSVAKTLWLPFVKRRQAL